MIRFKMSYQVNYHSSSMYSKDIFIHFNQVQYRKYLSKQRLLFKIC